MIRKESVMEQWSTFGSEAINVHYQSRNKQQLIDFYRKYRAAGTR
jgi:hypothetical protein